MKNFDNFNDYDRKENLHFDSQTVHGALGHDPFSGAVSFPIYQAATFRHRGLFESTGFDYSRLQNPTRQELERTMAILERGERAFAFTSGQAANAAVFDLLNPGDEVVLCDDIYGGTFRLGDSPLRKQNLTFTYVDMCDPANVEKAISSKTKMLFLETPTNPMMKVADISKIAEIAHAHGLIFVVDNTLMSPYFQKPLTLGADIVVHSGTKFIGGHHDVLAGIVVLKDKEYIDQIQKHLITYGSQLAPQDAWLLIRGLKTLHLRMERHSENAMKIANWLRTQDKVKKVYYAGFEDSQGYDIMKKQCTGFGGMLSFAVESADMVKKILKRVDLIYFAESLGGPETLITYPMTQTHESIPAEIRDALGITDCLLRLSAGLENADDLIADLDQAING